MKLTVTERPRQPLYPTRITNLLGKFKKQLFLDHFSMIEEASTATKLNDWGNEDFLPALKVFCDAVNEDTEMHCMGKLMARQTIVRSLIDRLQIQDTINNNPEILEKPIKKPIMIQGEPRAGTTLLHRLLAKDPQFRIPLSWELIFPIPPPDPKTYETDDRVKQTERLFKQILRLSPTLAITHPMESKFPDECWYLLHRTFIRPLDCLFLDIPKYQNWMLARSDEDLVTDYGYYRKQLQVLQWRFLKPRYVLKSPSHGFFLRSIVSVFPDIYFIHCHRDPKEILPSACSLAASREATYYNYIDFGKLGKRVMNYGKIRMNRVLDSREKIGSDRFFDLAFSQLVQEPIVTVKSLYKWLNLEFDQSVETRMKSFLESQRGGKHTRHRYSLEQFSLKRAKVDQAYERYQDQFRPYLNIKK